MMGSTLRQAPTRKEGRQRVLSVYLPRWSVDRLARLRRHRQRKHGHKHKHKTKHAVLLVSLVAGHQVVARCCERAARSGVVEGLRLAEAYALLRGRKVHVAAFDERGDLNALHALARWATKFSPVVEIDPPHGLLIGTHGCERLFGGEDVLVQAVLRDLRQMGFSVRAALAGTVGCAWGLARFGAVCESEFREEGHHETGKKHVTRDAHVVVAPGAEREAMRRLPIEALRLDAAAVDLLAEMGVERIEHLFPISREQLVSRFGESFLERLDQAFGTRTESVSLLPVSEPLRERFRFSNDVIDAGGMGDRYALIDVSKTLLDTLVARVDARHVAIGQLDLHMRYVHDLLCEEALCEEALCEEAPLEAAPFRTDAVNGNADLTRGRHRSYRSESRIPGSRSQRPDPHVRLILARPSVDPHHLGVLLRSRLEHLRLELGVEHLTLSATRVYPRRCMQQALFSSFMSPPRMLRNPEACRNQQVHRANESRGVSGLPSNPRPRSHADTRSGDVDTSKELGVLLDRLVEQCGGPHAGMEVVEMEVLDTHIPERAYVLRSVLRDRRSRPTNRGEGVHGLFGVGTDRPTKLFAAPERIALPAPTPAVLEATAETNAPPGAPPDEGGQDDLYARHIRRPPERFRWRGMETRVLQVEGPERIGAPWWDVPCLGRVHTSSHASSNGLGSRLGLVSRSLTYRDYFRVHDEYGRCLWMYFSSEAQQWFIHGIWL